MKTKADHIQTLTDETSKAGEEVGLKISTANIKQLSSGTRRGNKLKTKGGSNRRITKIRIPRISAVTEDGLIEEDNKNWT